MQLGSRRREDGGVWEGVSFSQWGRGLGRGLNIFIFELKMARFGAFYVLFLQVDPRLLLTQATHRGVNE